MKAVSADKLIHCIGDSHAGLFSGFDGLQRSLPHPSMDRLPQFRVHRVGPGLAYNLIKENSTTRSRERMIEVLTELPEGSRVLLSFGEVDCRSHLIQHAGKSGRPWESVAKDCADRYWEGTRIISEMGCKLAIYNVIPSSRYTKLSKAYPTAGTCAERNKMTRLFNQALKQKCAENNIPFVETFPDLTDASGITRGIYYFDKIHLAQRALPITVSAISRAIPNFQFIPPPNYKWHIFCSWLHWMFRERKRLRF